jgi:hypothetical protein
MYRDLFRGLRDCSAKRHRRGITMAGEQKQPVKHDFRLDLLYFIAVTFLAFSRS